MLISDTPKACGTIFKVSSLNRPEVGNKKYKPLFSHPIGLLARATSLNGGFRPLPLEGYYYIVFHSVLASFSWYSDLKLAFLNLILLLLVTLANYNSKVFLDSTTLELILLLSSIVTSQHFLIPFGHSLSKPSVLQWKIYGHSFELRRMHMSDNLPLNFMYII